MYKPPHCPTLAEITERPQIRLGIQGYGGTGKTFSALTFQSPIAFNIDKGLGVHTGREDVIEVPVYSTAFCKKVDSNFKPGEGREKLIIEGWLDKEGRKLEKDQTLVFDGNTGWCNAYHTYYRNNQTISKSGRVNEFAEWSEKIEYMGNICAMFRTFACDIVFLSHETEKKEKSGEYLGKIRPLVTGQFGDQLTSHFTDWFRQLSREKPKTVDKLKDTDAQDWGLRTASELFQFLNDTWPDSKAIYYWQTVSDDIFDAKYSSLINPPKFIPASYTYFKKYMRQFSSTPALAVVEA